MCIPFSAFICAVAPPFYRSRGCGTGLSRSGGVPELLNTHTLYGKRAGANRLTPEEHEELIRLRREVRRVTEERDILKKAVSIFSKELR